jgi:hypothetical protein
MSPSELTLFSVRRTVDSSMRIVLGVYVTSKTVPGRSRRSRKGLATGISVRSLDAVSVFFEHPDSTRMHETHDRNSVRSGNVFVIFPLAILYSPK